MSPSQIAKCPGCNHEQIYNGDAIRPRVHCIKCKKRFYITTPKTPKESKESNTNSIQKNHNALKTEGGADPPSNTIDKVDESTIEQGLIRLWNLGEINTNLMRCRVDYVIKIRGKSEEADEITDLEVLKQIGLNVKTGN